MKKSLVSVVMPAYKHQSFIQQAIESVLAQTYSNLELIVVDDSSPDATWEVINSFKDSRMTAFRNDCNRGAHTTLQRGLELASGDYIALINSDDIFSSRRLESLIANLDKSCSQFCFSDVEWIDEESCSLPDTHQRVAEYNLLKSYCLTKPSAAWLLAGNPVVTTSNFFFHRSALATISPFASLRYTHDWFALLKIASRSKLSWIHEPLLSYRVHATNTVAEADTMAHLHENAYIQASAILQLRQICHSQEYDLSDDSQKIQLLGALARNPSSSPLLTLLFLAKSFLSHTPRMAGTFFPELLSTLRDPWPLQQIANQADIPSELFSSTQEQKYWLDTINEQARLLEERLSVMQHYDEEIRSRDKLINDLDHKIQQNLIILGSRSRLLFFLFRLIFKSLLKPFSRPRRLS